MNNFKKYIVALSLSPMLFSACSDSFLTEYNPNNEVGETFWTNKDNLNSALAAVYNPIREHMYGYYGVFQGIWNNSMRADDLYPTRNEDAWKWGVVNFTNTTETWEGAGNVWSALYKGIQIANNFIDNAPNVVGVDKADIDEMLAEAYFMRGYHYFLLHINFRDAIIRTQSSAVDPSEHPLSSGEDVLKQCEDDFRKAKAGLPKTRPDGEKGRITQGAASAMLGKTLLWQGRYADAKAELANTISGYGYDLVEDYGWNYDNMHEFNVESVYEINYAKIEGADRGTWGDQTGANGCMWNCIANFFAPGCDKGGWYKMQPSAYLIDEFISEEREPGSDTRFDKRLYTTCFFPKYDYGEGTVDDEELAWGSIPFEEMWTANTGKLSPHPAWPEIDGKEGRFLMKKWSAWWCKAGASFYAGDEARDFNYRAMRFAEVLLLHAEACLESGDVPGAMVDINRVRSRAGLKALNLTDKEAATKEMRKQKLLELAGENLRWYDLIRWYDTEASLKQYLTEHKDAGQNIAAFKERFRYLPIPQGEVDGNRAVEQKPEWK